MSATDPRPIEVRLEAAFDRYNRAVILGMEPTPLLFIDALETEGLQLSLWTPEPKESREPARSGSPVGGRTGRLIARRARALF